jgi:hypothetical protein
MVYMELKLLKGTVMKKLIAFIVVSIAMVSCYEEYLLDYPYTGIYFPIQQDVRTFVVGEGMQFKVGATLGGVRQNTVDRNVTFSLNTELITAVRLASMKSASQNHIKNPTATVAALELLPATYYSLSNNSTMVIKSGLHTGTVTVKADSAAYLADSLKTCRISTYVLPFYINDADADTVLESRRYNVVGTMFENMLFGNYWHGGSAQVDRSAAGKADTTIKYYTTIPIPENRIWTLTTTGPTTLSCNGYFNATVGAGKKHMNLVLKGTKIYLSDGTDATYTFAPDGACTFNKSKLLQDRRIYLKYQFTDAAGNIYHCTDTLRFRNRIRDGINEWQDENPSHYE